MNVHRLALIVVAASFASGCRPMPTVAPAGGAASRGVMARFLPVDPATPAIPADGRSGEVAPTDLHWPPAPVHADCTAGSDELADFEASLGVTASDACPVFQSQAVGTISVTTGGAPIGSPRPLDHNRYCFAQGNALIVVETTERLAPRCTHVVGLAVYRKGT